jgi:hypothetical protein
LAGARSPFRELKTPKKTILIALSIKFDAAVKSASGSDSVGENWPHRQLRPDLMTIYASAGLIEM